MSGESEQSDAAESNEPAQPLRLLAAYRTRSRWAAAAAAAVRGGAAGAALAAWLLALTACPPAVAWPLWAAGVAAAALLTLTLPTASRAITLTLPSPSRERGRSSRATRLAWPALGAAAAGLAALLAGQLAPGGLDPMVRWIAAGSAVAAAAGLALAAECLRRRPLRAVALEVDRLGAAREQWVTAVQLADAPESAFAGLQRGALLDWHRRCGAAVRFFRLSRPSVGVLVISVAAAGLLALLPPHLSAEQAQVRRAQTATGEAAAALGRLVGAEGGLLDDPRLTDLLIQSLRQLRSDGQGDADAEGVRITRRELMARLDTRLADLDALQRAARETEKALAGYEATGRLSLLLGQPARAAEAEREVAQTAAQLAAGRLDPAARNQWEAALRAAAAASEDCFPLWRALTAAADAMAAGDGTGFEHQMKLAVQAMAGADRARRETEEAIAALTDVQDAAQAVPPEPVEPAGEPTAAEGPHSPAVADGHAAAGAPPGEGVFSGGQPSQTRPDGEPPPAAGSGRFLPLEAVMAENAPSGAMLENLDAATRQMIRRYFASDPAAEP